MAVLIFLMHKQCEAGHAQVQFYKINTLKDNFLIKGATSWTFLCLQMLLILYLCASGNQSF